MTYGRLIKFEARQQGTFGREVAYPSAIRQVEHDAVLRGRRRAGTAAAGRPLRDALLGGTLRGFRSLRRAYALPALIVLAIAVAAAVPAVPAAAQSRVCGDDLACGVCRPPLRDAAVADDAIRDQPASNQDVPSWTAAPCDQPDDPARWGVFIA